MKPEELLKKAAAAAQNAYAPHSNFRVGAALLTANGEVFPGCNVENASYGATVCAERNAVAQAVASGMKQFVMLAVVTNTSPPSAPCGLCRQVLVEFSRNLPVILSNPKGEIVRTKMSKLLPDPFEGKSL